MPIGINDQLFIAGSSSSLDAFWGPYADVATALSTVTSTYRAIGKKVGIINGNVIDTYAWVGGTADNQLVKIASAEGGGGSSAPTYVDPAGLPVNSNTNAFLTSNYSGDPVGTKVFDTPNRFVYEKIANGVWAKTAAVSPDDDMDPAGVIQGVNLISYK